MSEDLTNALVDIAGTHLDDPLPVSTTDPFTAMVERLATNADVDADKLQKLVDVQMQIMDRNAELEFNNAMALVQEQLPVVTADAYNDQTQSRYSRIESIVKAIRPVYTKEGFSTSFSEAPSDREGYIRVKGVLRHRGGHHTDHYADLPIDDRGIKGSVNKTPLHATGSTFSYGRRYVTLMMFDLATGEDDDGMGAMDYKTTLSEAQQADLLALATELFGDLGHQVLTSLAKRRFNFADGDWKNIPVYRLADAQRSLREKAEEE